VLAETRRCSINYGLVFEAHEDDTVAVLDIDGTENDAVAAAIKHQLSRGVETPRCRAGA
jgi:hypothetical protein